MHASLADGIVDLVQNSIEAAAGDIQLVFRESPDELFFRITDSGRGMDKDTLARAEDPFWTDGIKHPGRRVGLGIPFLRQTAEQCGGRADIRSKPGEGTVIEAVFPADHLDLPPLGDMVLLWVQCLLFAGEHEMRIRRERVGANGRLNSYEIDRAELVDVLGSLEDVGALGLLRDYLRGLEDSLDSDEQGER